MIKKFICWFWGHKRMGGFHFEKILESTKSGFSFYRLGMKWCARCGELNFREGELIK